MRAVAFFVLTLALCVGCPGGDSPPGGTEIQISPAGPLTIEVGQSETVDITLITTLPDVNISVDVPESSSVAQLIPSQASCDFPGGGGGFSPRKSVDLECEFVGPTTVTVFASRIDNTDPVSRTLEVDCVAEGVGPGSGGDGGTGRGSGGSGGFAGGPGQGGSGGVGGSTEPIACGSGVCGGDDYCDDPLDRCDATADGVFCSGRLPPASDCEALGGNVSVCGCDSQVYDNVLCAQQAGTDISFAGGCTPPSGTFACGSTFCDPLASFCSLRDAPVSVCEVLPGGCGGVATCDCIVTPCPPGQTSQGCVENAGEVTVTCTPE